jgi:hypothetical protein
MIVECKHVFALMFPASIALLPTFVCGQNQPTTQPALSDAEWRQQMEARMQQLEQENRVLREKLGSVAETQQAVMKDAQERGLLSLEGGRPRLTTPETFDVNKYAAQGDFPGSFTIPGTNMSIQVGGFVQLDAITDSNTIGSKDSFVVSSIPTDAESAGESNFSVRQTRLFVRTKAPTSWGPLVTHVEGDFFGPDGTDLRLRHAYGQVGEKHQLLAGQIWTTFMDASVYPAIFDYQGPNGMVLVRQPMLRYTFNFRDDAHWQIALEDPNPDLSEAPGQTGNDTSVLPDLASNVRWSPDWGHLQLSGILRQLTFDPPVGSRTSELGWGLNFSGSVKMFEPIAEGKQDNIVFQIAGGEGIGNYFNDSSGLGLDGFVNSGGDLDALGIWGGFVAYQHYWLPKWATSVGYSYLQVDDSSDQGGGAYEKGHYAVANIMFYPTDRVWLGLEGLYGVREDQDGDSGDDGRVSFSVQYRF